MKTAILVLYLMSSDSTRMQVLKPIAVNVYCAGSVKSTTATAAIKK